MRIQEQIRSRRSVRSFSAGGHLAASLGILWNHPDLKLDSTCRPDALVLCYPVITAGEYAHRGSIGFVTQGDPWLTELLCLEKQVTAHMPPAFLWHCTGNESVPVENSLLLLTAMQRVKVPYECHLFTGGAHGISVCTQEVETPYPDIAPWFDLCTNWLNRQFQYTP